MRSIYLAYTFGTLSWCVEPWSGDQKQPAVSRARVGRVELVVDRVDRHGLAVDGAGVDRRGRFGAGGDDPRRRSWRCRAVGQQHAVVGGEGFRVGGSDRAVGQRADLQRRGVGGHGDREGGQQTHDGEQALHRLLLLLPLSIFNKSYRQFFVNTNPQPCQAR